MMKPRSEGLAIFLAGCFIANRPALLRRQLRALLLAAGDRDLSVMFPMVATAEEFRVAKSLLLAEAHQAITHPSCGA